MTPTDTLEPKALAAKLQVLADGIERLSFDRRSVRRMIADLATQAAAYLSTASIPQAGTAPYAEGGIGSKLASAAIAHLGDYVFSPDEGPDHYLTDFERTLIEDFIWSLTGDTPFNDILLATAAALVVPAPEAPKQEPVAETLRDLDYLIDEVVAEAYVRGVEGRDTETSPHSAKTLHDAIAKALAAPPERQVVEGDGP